MEVINDIRVGMAELKVAKAPGRIITLGLGSCIGVCVYDTRTHIGGMAHIMLPTSSMAPTAATESVNPAKFADTAVPLLIQEMEKLGAGREGLIVKIVGGAQMFCGNGYEDHICIGNKNIIAVETVCQQLGLFVSSRSVGGNSGKSVFLDLDTGEVQVRTLNEYIMI